MQHRSTNQPLGANFSPLVNLRDVVVVSQVIVRRVELISDLTGRRRTLGSDLVGIRLGAVGAILDTTAALKTTAVKELADVAKSIHRAREKVETDVKIGFG